MLVNNYKAIANIYNHLMIEIEYIEWADYIYDIYRKNRIPKGYSLELACGNGILAKFLSPKFNNFFISDKSKEMLFTIPEFNQNKICFDMLYIPLKNKYSFIYSTFDSVNYITNINNLKLFFANIDRLLIKGGCFTFDVSLEKNSLIVENDLNREGIFNGYHYNQQSTYNKKTRIHENSFIIISPEGKQYEEIHIQKIYKFEDYFKAIEGTKLFVKACYNSFTFDDALPTDERIQFILKKG